MGMSSFKPDDWLISSEHDVIMPTTASREINIFFIVLLGAAFFSGIRSAEGDMKVSADRYYDEVNYMDLKEYLKERMFRYY